MSTCATCRNITRFAGLVAMLAYRDIRVRYKRAWLGMLWALGTPLALAFAFTIVFRVFFGAPIARYPLYALAGLYPWMYFQRALVNATSSFQLSAEILRQMPVPRASLPLADVLVEAMHLGGSLVLLFFLAPLLGGELSWKWIQILPVFAITVSTAAGIGMTLAPLQARFRDTKYVVELALLLLFYAVPIIYRPEMAPAGLRPWIEKNPASLLVMPYQRVLYDGALLGMTEWVLLAAYAAAALGVGYAAVTWLGRNAADYV